VGGALDGRTAMVSGAGRGIGASIAQTLDAAGARVALIARTESQLKETAATLANDPVVVVADLGTHDGPPPQPPRRSRRSAVASTSSSTTPPSRSASRATN
jgi:NAD(P)-dependent dehydrogenase (short-subunit alcohol dehydrogenase family)